MTATRRADVELAVESALAAVAPEADFATLDRKGNLREQLDIDSMDFLNFVVGVHRALGVDVPERDYAKLATFDACVEYLLAATVSSART